ncbi:M6 family metalloprotease domain-containing protein [Streptomyces sp. NPDC001941]|uniref:M6 family metalloprotease domain-containing protein n=1 Tax=Streptomyces sp. NPDC001941 TaxID=3154659 RepID=UPI0033326DE4
MRGAVRRISVSVAACVALVAAVAPVRAEDPARPAPRAQAPSGPCALAGPPDSGARYFEGVPTPGNFARSTGTVRAYTVFVDFPDAPATVTPRERYAEFFPAVSDYFARASYGRLDYRPMPRFSWIRMSKPLASYGIGRGVPFSPGYAALTAEVARAVRAEADPGAYDLLNVLVTPNAGPDALETVLSVTYSGGTFDFGRGAVPFAGSFVWSRQTGDSPWRVLAHENGHAFGLPDLYLDGGGGTTAGHWDLMDEDWGPANDLMAWHKWKLGWLGADQAVCADAPGTREFTLRPLSVPGGTKLVTVPLDGERALTLEARTKSALDAAVCRPGVLVAGVGTRVAAGEGPVRVRDATPGSAGCFRDPNVNAALSDAAYQPGQTFTDRAHGIAVQVLGVDAAGDYRVRVARGAQAVASLPPASEPLPSASVPTTPVPTTPVPSLAAPSERLPQQAAAGDGFREALERLRQAVCAQWWAARLPGCGR